MCELLALPASYMLSMRFTSPAFESLALRWSRYLHIRVISAALDLQPCTEVISAALDLQPCTEVISAALDLQPCTEVISAALDLQPCTKISIIASY